MIRVLPHFLDGLFQMLADRNEDIKQSVDTCLSEFLAEIKAAAGQLESVSIFWPSRCTNSIREKRR